MARASVSSVADLVKVLGGPAAAARAFNVRPQVVCNWRERGRIPTRLFLDHERMLAQAQIAAPITLWGFAPPMTREVAA